MHTSAPRGRSEGSRHRVQTDLLHSRLCSPSVTGCRPPGRQDRARMSRAGPHCGGGISCPLVLGDSPGGRVPTVSCPSGCQALLLTPGRGSRGLARRVRRLPRAGVSGLSGRRCGETDFNYLEEKLKGRKCQSRSREAADRGSSPPGSCRAPPGSAPLVLGPRVGIALVRAAAPRGGRPAARRLQGAPCTPRPRRLGLTRHHPRRVRNASPQKRPLCRKACVELKTLGNRRDRKDADAPFLPDSRRRRSAVEARPRGRDSPITGVAGRRPGAARRAGPGQRAGPRPRPLALVPVVPVSPALSAGARPGGSRVVLSRAAPRVAVSCGSAGGPAGDLRTRSRVWPPREPEPQEIIPHPCRQGIRGPGVGRWGLF